MRSIRMFGTGRMQKSAPPLLNTMASNTQAERNIMIVDCDP